MDGSGIEPATQIPEPTERAAGGPGVGVFAHAGEREGQPDEQAANRDLSIQKVQEADDGDWPGDDERRQLPERAQEPHSREDSVAGYKLRYPPGATGSVGLDPLFSPAQLRDPVVEESGDALGHLGPLADEMVIRR